MPVTSDRFYPSRIYLSNIILNCDSSKRLLVMLRQQPHQPNAATVLGTYGVQLHIISGVSTFLKLGTNGLRKSWENSETIRFINCWQTRFVVICREYYRILYNFHLKKLDTAGHCNYAYVQAPPRAINKFSMHYVVFSPVTSISGKNSHYLLVFG